MLLLPWRDLRFVGLRRGVRAEREKGNEGRTENIFVPDRDLFDHQPRREESLSDTYTQDMFRPVRLQRLLNRLDLILIRLFVRIDIHRQVDLHIHFRIPYRLEHQRGLVAVGAVEAEFVGQLGEELDVACYVGLGCAARWEKDVLR